MQELEEIKVIPELEIEIRDTQYLFDTSNGVARKLAQEDMVKLLNKKKMAASSQQGKSKKKLTTRVRIRKNTQRLILAFQLGIVTTPSKDDSKFYKQNWPSLVKDAEEKN